ncbi:hypothetical protein B0H21DRAFT_154584 [Amylocystis lapponica]|nr:hypothetical protein B0H21DRAFT_154584 [Amylocystis lapponica]
MMPISALLNPSRTPPGVRILHPSPDSFVLLDTRALTGYRASKSGSWARRSLRRRLPPSAPNVPPAQENTAQDLQPETGGSTTNPAPASGVASGSAPMNVPFKSASTSREARTISNPSQNDAGGDKGKEHQFPSRTSPAHIPEPGEPVQESSDDVQNGSRVLAGSGVYDLDGDDPDFEYDVEFEDEDHPVYRYPPVHPFNTNDSTWVDKVMDGLRQQREDVKKDAGNAHRCIAEATVELALAIEELENETKQMDSFLEEVGSERGHPLCAT